MMKRLFGKAGDLATLIAGFAAVAWLVGEFVAGMAGAKLRRRG